MNRALGTSIITLTGLLLSTLTACPTATPEPDPPEVITGIENLPGGDALVPGVAMFPFPSDFWLRADASSQTGRRTAYPEGLLPEPLTPETFADHDGFSRIPSLLAYFDATIDPTSLPPLDQPGATTEPGSSVLLLREDTWERVPALVELDANAEWPFEQSLIVRPRRILDAGTGYVVLISTAVRTTGGEALPVSEAFRALRDDIATDSDAVEAWRDDFALVNRAIAGSGLAPTDVVLGWSFHTRSEESVVGPLLGMQQVAMEVDLPAWELVSDTIDGDDRLVYGTVTVPNFLDEDSLVQVDASGAPIQEGIRSIEFLVTIPVELDSPRPVVAFGHGFFSLLEEPTWGSMNAGLHRWGMSAISTNFMGFNEDDALATFAILGGNLSDTYAITSQQLQSLSHFTILSRLVTEQLAGDARLTGPSGGPVLDGDKVRYMGISNGGTQGLTLMATSPAYDHGVLVVPGGAWTHMLERAVQWNDMGAILRDRFPEPRVLQLALSLSQPLLDAADSLNYAQHLVTDRFPGMPPARVVLHEAKEDSQVANLVTHWVARSANVPLITPSPIPVWGLETIEAPEPDGADSSAGLYIYDLGADPQPLGNLPPEFDNDTHADVRNREDYQEHVGRFLEDGTIVQVCDGPCDEPDGVAR
jgi:hypothetical protein